MVKKISTFLMLLLLLISAPLFAIEVPALKGRVNDYAKIIRDSDEREIEEYLAALDQSTGIQLAVLTMPSLEGDDIASFGIRVADKWKLGDKDKDNGAILIVAYAEHDLRIEVGDGLEGSLTDAKCGLILRNVIVPEFKNGDYSEGIRKGLMNMGGLASGDESAVSRSVREGNSDSSSDNAIVYIICFIWLMLFFFCVAAGSKRNRRGRYVYRGPNNVAKSAAAATIMRAVADAAISSALHSSGSSHSGGFGGFSGGGGHFSGGGASAHW